MPFPMKIQPIDPNGPLVRAADQTAVSKPAAKSRLKRLFERQFPGVLRNSSSEKLAGAGDVEPSSVCLDKMVINFIEESGAESKQSARCGKSRCNCFHGNCDDRSDEESDLTAGDAPAISSADAADLIKGWVICATVAERNLLADVSTLVDKNKSCKRKEELRKIVADGLRSIGYDSSVCKSRWDKSPSFPAGEYEYLDVVLEGAERVIVDVDFRSEFEIARSTKGYRGVLQSLPSIYVGKGDRLQQIVAIVAEAARQSLNKKGLHFPPWRKLEYMRNKWLAPYERTAVVRSESVVRDNISTVDFCEKESQLTAVIGWEPPPVKPKAVQTRPRVVTGLASVLKA